MLDRDAGGPARRWKKTFFSVAVAPGNGRQRSVPVNHNDQGRHPPGCRPWSAKYSM